MFAVVRCATVAALLAVAGAAAAQERVTPERGAMLRREAYKEIAVDPCNMPVSRLQAVVKSMNALGLSESDYIWNNIRLAACARMSGRGLPPLEDALWAMTDARNFDPCTYELKKDYGDSLFEDPRYLTFATRINYDEPSTYGRFQSSIERMPPDRRACFFDLLAAVVTGSAWTPRPPSAPPISSAAARRPPEPAGVRAGTAQPTPSPPRPAAPSAPPQTRGTPPPPPPSAPDEAIALTSPTEGVLAGVDLEKRVLTLQLQGRTDVVSFLFDDTTTVSALDGNARLLVRSEGRALDNVRSVRLQWMADPADSARRQIIRVTVTGMR